MHMVQHLQWDSDLFGFGVAAIDAGVSDIQEVSHALDALRVKNVKLVYWPSKRKIGPDQAARLNGLLADEKTHFVIDLRDVAPVQKEELKSVKPYTKAAASKDLIELALLSGEYSRFARDPRIPREKFIELYRIWIERSVKREIADEVFVIQKQDQAVGLITVGEKNRRGDIGLVAVALEFRGQGIGRLLVSRSLDWFTKNGVEIAQVVTQGFNQAACGLYKKCGFHVERVEYFYHFWL